MIPSGSQWVVVPPVCCAASSGSLGSRGPQEQLGQLARGGDHRIVPGRQLPILPPVLGPANPAGFASCSVTSVGNDWESATAP
jgi:hypothetical protein